MKSHTLSFAFAIGLAAVSAHSSAHSQSVVTEMGIIQEAFGLDKKVAVANAMNLDDQAESFGKFYDP